MKEFFQFILLTVAVAIPVTIFLGIAVIISAEIYAGYSEYQLCRIAAGSHYACVAKAMERK